MRPITSLRSQNPAVQPPSGLTEDQTIAAPAESRSLVVVGAPVRCARGVTRCSRPSAPFLAQLIAGAQQAPQTRARRQAEPAEAAQLYAAAQAGWTRRVLRSQM